MAKLSSEIEPSKVSALDKGAPKSSVAKSAVAKSINETSTPVVASIESATLTKQVSIPAPKLIDEKAVVKSVAPTPVPSPKSSGIGTSPKASEQPKGVVKMVDVNEMFKMSVVEMTGRDGNAGSLPARKPAKLEYVDTDDPHYQSLGPELDDVFELSLKQGNGDSMSAEQVSISIAPGVKKKGVQLKKKKKFKSTKTK